MALRIISAKDDDAVGLALGEQDQAEFVAGDAGEGVLGPQEAAEAARQRQQDRVAGREADRVVDRLEAVEVEDDDRRPEARILAREGERRLEPVEEQLRGSAGR